MKVYERKTWRNTIKKHKVTPIKFFEPESIDDLVQVIREAEARNLRVRAVGSGHSFTDVAVCNDYLLDIYLLNRFLDLDKSRLKPEFRKAHLVEVEAGMKVEDFNIGLDARDLAITNMGGIDHQSLAGAISTGTHGTGINLPAMSGMVRSMVLVSAGGKIYRIEPADGITDPAAYNDPEIKLLQDDDVFYSILVSLGGMGIVYSYILEVQEMYYLKEVKSLDKWSVVKEQLRDRSIFEGTRSVMMQVNPYPRDDGDHTCLVVKHFHHPVPGKLKLMEQTRNWISCFFGNIPVSYYYSVYRAKAKPSNTPKLIESSLKALKDLAYINKAYRILYQSFEYIKERAFDSEFAFDVSSNAHIDAVEAIFEVAARLATEGNLYQTSPLGLRLVQRSKAYLTPEYGREVCYIDIPFLRHTRGGDDMLDHYQDRMLAMGGIPHWGKTNNRLEHQTELIETFYPHLKIWKEVFRRFNPKDTFTNGFLERMELAE